MSGRLTIGRNPVVEMARANLGIIIVILIIGAVLSLLSPVFLSPFNLRTVLLQITTNMYIALGMTLVMILGGIDLSVGSIVAMSGTLAVGFMALNHMPMWLAVPLGLALGAGTGLLNGLVVAYFKLPSFIVTLAMLNVARGVAYVYSGGHSTRMMDPIFTGIGSGYLWVIPLPVLYMVVLIAVFVVILNRTKFGTYIYAIGGNRESARLSGVPIKKVEIITFTISGLMAAFAGLVLSARMFSGQPSATSSTRSRPACSAAHRSAAASAGSAERCSARSSSASSATVSTSSMSARSGSWS
jgi:ribose transport system permease protein